MINHNKPHHKGPIYSAVRKTPIVYNAMGGNPLGPIPNIGFLQASSSVESYLTSSKPIFTAGQGANMGSAYPPIGTNEFPSTGHNPYEPLKLSFIHKFGGPHMSSQGQGAIHGSQWLTEEFLRVKLKKDEINGVYCPYNNAVLTATVFPYGQTNKGIVPNNGNRSAVSLIRNRFTFQAARPSSSYAYDLLTYNPPTFGAAGYFAPLYSSSIVNHTINRGIGALEFHLQTHPEAIQGSYGIGGTCIDITKTTAMSVHPEVSEGDLTNFNAEGGSGNWDGILGGADVLNDVPGYQNSTIQHRMQGKTDGNDLCFFARAQKGSIIKGIIELY